jgi:SAM-dependent methyltransferase
MSMSDASAHAERTVPTAAGVYDWWLGGHHHRNCEADAATAALKRFPLAAALARANRAFLYRGVKFLVDSGITQFLDLGSGYPVAGNVHEIAAPGSRVVYVDHDPDTVAVSRTMLADTPDATCIHADLRDVDQLLGHPEVTALLDLEAPIGLLMVDVLHFVLDDADALVAAYQQRLAPGSYLVISHGVHAEDELTRRLMDNLTHGYNNTVRQQARGRTVEEVHTLFGEAALVEPGLVPVPDWRPLQGAKYAPHPGDAPVRAVLYGAVGHLPERLIGE